MSPLALLFQRHDMLRSSGRRRRLLDRGEHVVRRISRRSDRAQGRQGGHGGDDTGEDRRSDELSMRDRLARAEAEAAEVVLHFADLPIPQDQDGV